MGISIKSAGAWIDTRQEMMDQSLRIRSREEKKSRIIEGGCWLAHEELRTLDVLLQLAMDLSSDTSRSPPQAHLAQKAPMLIPPGPALRSVVTRNSSQMGQNICRTTLAATSSDLAAPFSCNLSLRRGAPARGQRPWRSPRYGRSGKVSQLGGGFPHLQ